ncbi:hypothetical protein D4R52_03320 [bacterium]|nr:MAG: hypothetical protein D4R52_03320 [bacterium]
MVTIPQLPEKEELEFREKEFFLSLREQMQASRKWLFWVLLAIFILSFPAKLYLQKPLANYFIGRYVPPLVNTNPYNPSPLKVLRTGILPVQQGTYSVYAQILNPNPEVTARQFHYQFALSDQGGVLVKTVEGDSFIMAGDSSFLLVPQVNTDKALKQVAVAFSNVRWTSSRPDTAISFDVLQKNTGVSAEGKFFVEAVVHNPQSFGFRQVEVPIMVFDRANKDIIAINYTVLTDVRSQEGRYFRVIWPVQLANFGQIQISPNVNPLSPGWLLEKVQKIPSR